MNLIYMFRILKTEISKMSKRMIEMILVHTLLLVPKSKPRLVSQIP